MTTFLIVYLLSAILVGRETYLDLRDMPYLTTPDIILCLCLVFVPILNTVWYGILIGYYVFYSNKELTNPFYKEKDRD